MNSVPPPHCSRLDGHQSLAMRKRRVATLHSGAVRKIGFDPHQALCAGAKRERHCADPDFGKALFTQTIDQPPYCVGTETADVHFTCGGLRINPETEMPDVEGKVIPGLYAAGEATGGVHGADRAGGNSLTAIFVFGRIAGNDAAALAKA